MLPKGAESKKRFLLVYGSETGQAQAIAEEITEKAPEFGLEAALHCLDQTGKRFNIEDEKCVVIITSTTGDGDPPANASKFMRRIKKRTLSDTYLSHLHYSLLGLGDTNYSNFCRCARDMDKRLEQLGAQKFYPTGLADDGVGLEVVAEPWLEGLYPAVQKFLSEAESDKSSKVLTNSEVNPAHSEKQNLEMSETIVNGLQSLSPNENKDVDRKVIDKTNEQNNKPSVNGIVAPKTNSHVSDPSDTSVNPNTNICNGVMDSDANSQSFSGMDRTSKSEMCFCETVCVKVNVKDMIFDGSCGLIQQSSKLEGKALTVPALSPAFLHVEFTDKSFETSSLSYQNNCKLPSAASEILHIPVTSAKVVTHPEAVKKTLLLILNHQDHKVDYSPGDAISIVCPNNQSEVNLLLERLNQSKVVENKMTLHLIPNTQKRRAVVPPHLHPVTTLRYVFTHCVSMRDPPSKAFLRVLVEFTSNDKEARRIQELCSKEGTAEYTAWIREKHISLLDFLYAFPSCQPPIERVLEFLPRLQPRPYSLCSYKDENPESFEIVFNLVTVTADVSNGHFYDRRGVCTGWLDDITRDMQNCQERDNSFKVKIPIFLRTNQHFRPPSDLSKPLIMVGPGTGVAPFLGFLQQRAWMKKQLADTSSYGETLLFFGCRDKKKDFLFQKELEEYLSLGVLTRMCVAVSRDESEPYRYVQDYLRAESQSIARLVSDEQALVYVCGDAQNMAKDVGVAFENILESEKGLSVDDAHLAIMKKRLARDYLEDVWV